MQDHFQYLPNHCIICGSEANIFLGIRGTREYSGADIHAEPHVVTNVVKCKTCGFIYTNPLVTGLEHLERDHYNDTKAYKTAEIEDLSRMFSSRVSIIKKFISSGKLLDVGAGKGEFLNAAKNMGFTCTGVEPSPNFCNYASSNFGLEMHSGFLGQVEALAKRTFNVISMLHVLEHVEQPHELLETIKSNLEPDGILFIEVPNSDSTFLKIIDLYYKFKGLGWSSRLSPFHPPYHKFGYTASSLKYLLEKHGYEVIESETLSGRDRGFEKKQGQIKTELWLRDRVLDLVDVLGKRELLYIVAKRKPGE